MKQEKEVIVFRLIYVIVSGNLAQQFFNSYTTFTYTTIIAATIVFCNNKALYYNKPYKNDLYLNPGGIVDDFIEVIEYIQNENDSFWRYLKCIKANSIILPQKMDNSKNKLIYSDDLSEITLPIILTEIITENLIHNEDIVSFNE